MERDDPRIRALVASVASTVTRRLDAVAGNIQSVIEDAIPALQLDDSTTLLQASVGENVDVALRTLVDGTSPFATAAPAAAVEYARRLAQQDVPATLLIRAYRVGQARFLHDCIEELLRQTTADHLEVLATQHMVAIVSEYVDHVVEQVLTSYAESRDAWLRDRSAVLAMRIREVLRGERIDVSATERALDYRFDRCHQALVLWVDEPGDDAYVRIRRVVAAAGTALGPGATPLVVPCDECRRVGVAADRLQPVWRDRPGAGGQGRTRGRPRRWRARTRHRRVPQEPSAGHQRTNRRPRRGSAPGAHDGIRRRRAHRHAVRRP